MQLGQYNILSWRWYSGLKTVGFVAIQSGPNQWKVYTGPAAGNDEEIDIMEICALGCKVEESVAQAVFAHLYDELEYGGVQDVPKEKNA